MRPTKRHVRTSVSQMRRSKLYSTDQKLTHASFFPSGPCGPHDVPSIERTKCARRPDSGENRPDVPPPENEPDSTEFLLDDIGQRGAWHPGIRDVGRSAWGAVCGCDFFSDGYCDGRVLEQGDDVRHRPGHGTGVSRLRQTPAARSRFGLVPRSAQWAQPGDRWGGPFPVRAHEHPAGARYSDRTGRGDNQALQRRQQAGKSSRGESPHEHAPVDGALRVQFPSRDARRRCVIGYECLQPGEREQECGEHGIAHRNLAGPLGLPVLCGVGLGFSLGCRKGPQGRLRLRNGRR